MGFQQQSGAGSALKWGVDIIMGSSGLEDYPDGMHPLSKRYKDDTSDGQGQRREERKITGPEPRPAHSFVHSDFNLRQQPPYISVRDDAVSS
jgi:hypothetical protein